MSTPSQLVQARPFTSRYVRVLGAFFVLQALSGAAVKLVQGRGDDLPHAGLHLVSGLVALWASSPRRASSTPSRFAVGFGVLYLMLGVLGPLEAPALAALHLELPDHVFHVAVGAATFGVGTRSWARQRSDLLGCLGDRHDPDALFPGSGRRPGGPTPTGISA